jgi:hypothetical protein
METTQVRRVMDFAIAGYLLLSAVLVAWIIWSICFLLNQTSDERVIMFYKIIPRTLLGIGSDNLMVILSAFALFLGIIEKLRIGRKWYKTESYIRVLILFSGFLLFMNIFQIIF